MVRPERDRLAGRVEVDETYPGGLKEGVRGRQTEAKALIVVVAQEDGPTCPKSLSELMPRVHRVISLLKRWLMGTQAVAIDPAPYRSMVKMLRNPAIARPQDIGAT